MIPAVHGRDPSGRLRRSRFALLQNGRTLVPVPARFSTNNMAEREGFEPSVEFNPYNCLAGSCLQPLGHLSADFVVLGIFYHESG